MQKFPLWPRGLLLLLFVAAAGLGLWRMYDAQAYHNSEIVLGQSCALSGPSAELGYGMMIGANAWFNYVNDHGGIRGRKIRLITLDDRYEPRLTEENTQKLIDQERVFALFGYVGTPTSQSILPLIEESNIPFIGPMTGAGFLRKPSHPLVVNLRAGYEAEIDLMARHLKSRGIQRVAIFYQNDSYGKTGLYAARTVLARQKLELVAEGSYNRNTLALGHALYEIVPQKPQAIIMIDAYKPGAEFIHQARQEGLTDTIFAHVSFVNSDSLGVELGALSMKNVLVTQVVPPPWDPSYPEVFEYQSIMTDYYPSESFTFASLEGFLTAKALTEGLEKSGERLTRENLLRAMRRLQRERPEPAVWLTGCREGRMRVIDENRP